MGPAPTPSCLRCCEACHRAEVPQQHDGVTSGTLNHAHLADMMWRGEKDGRKAPTTSGLPCERLSVCWQPGSMAGEPDKDGATIAAALCVPHAAVRTLASRHEHVSVPRSPPSPWDARRPRTASACTYRWSSAQLPAAAYMTQAAALLEAAAWGEQLQQLAGLRAAHAAVADVLPPLQALCAEALTQRSPGMPPRLHHGCVRMGCCNVCMADLVR